MHVKVEIFSTEIFSAKYCTVPGPVYNANFNFFPLLGTMKRLFMSQVFGCWSTTSQLEYSGFPEESNVLCH